MSAIAGIFHLDEEPVSIDDGKNIMTALHQYPADDIQTWYEKNIFLGCHAQWITPESVGENLPYYDAGCGLAITADAIIDNRQELFDRLKIGYSHGKKISDSELILLAYRNWGEEVPKYLTGDFAFMIWDKRRRLMFGARDFSGNRTLYYYVNGQRFAFCTIIRPLLTLPYIAKELNQQWLAEFLAIPGVHDVVGPTSTAYKNIEQVPPSHSISIARGSVTLTRYCDLSPGEPLKLKSNQEYEEAFRDVFQEAVIARTRTRHQVGAQLSGGLDSGSVVSFAAKALRNEKKRLHTFSYVPAEGFIDWTPKRRIADERPFIQATVDYVGNIEDHYSDFAGKSPLSDVDDWLDTLEMPYKFFGNSFWIKGIYESACNHGIGVLLNGARGNYTISWGLPLDYYAGLFRKLNWIRLYRELNLFSKNKRLNKSQILPIVFKKAFPFIDQIFLSKEQYCFPKLINPEFAKRTTVFEKLQEHGIDVTGSAVQNAYEGRKKQFELLNFWNLNGTSGTKISLRYGLWDRDPTNDLRVIRFCLSVPEEQFVQNGLDRALIRRSTKNFLPDKVRLNQQIRGIQGADGIYRMASVWDLFIKELQQITKDNLVSEFLNIDVIKEAISKVWREPKPDYVFRAEFNILMRSLIFYRFIKKFA